MSVLKTLEAVLSYSTIGFKIARSVTEEKMQMILSFILNGIFIALFSITGNKNAVYVVITTAALLVIKIWWQDALKVATVIAAVAFLVIGVYTSKDFYDWILVVGNLSHVLHVFMNAKDIKDEDEAARRTRKSQIFLLIYNMCWVVFDAKRQIIGAMYASIVSVFATAMSLLFPKQLKKGIAWIKQHVAHIGKVFKIKKK